ncbi:MAG: hypothetical protein LBJ24_06435 [Treponema sp.]|jgi:hypothetical protein|nr:hypothetical protein [Treponema sp.]
MKSKRVLVVMFSMVLVFGGLFVGCDTGNDPGENVDLSGTNWRGTVESQSVTLSFINGTNWELGYTDSYLYEKGTYTVSNNTVSFTRLEDWTGSNWISSTETFSGTVSGTTLILEDVVFTKN